MDILVTPSSIKDFVKYEEASIFLVGNSSFCEGYTYSYTLEEIDLAINEAKRLDKKIYINVNKIFQEFELSNLNSFLSMIIQRDIDGIVYTDMAVYQIIKELGKSDLLIYASQTQIVNKYDAKYYLDLGIKSVLISKECNLEMLKNIIKYVPKKTILFAHGYMQIFYSRRKLLENYAIEHNLDINELINKYDIKASEFTRNKPFPLFQDENGTIIFSDYVLCCAKYLKDLINKGLDIIWLDGLFLPLEYQLDVLKLYSNIANNKEYDLEAFFLKYPNIPHGDEVLLKEDSII